MKVGDKFPDATLPDARRKKVKLSSFKGKPLVVYFYPADDTPGCTKQACTFRDQYADFVDAGANVVGISSDDPDTHKAFAERHNLPFTLLCDQGGHFRSKVGVPKTFGLMDGRVTYILDEKMQIVHIFNSQLKATRHVQEALKGLQKVTAAPA